MICHASFRPNIPLLVAAGLVRLPTPDDPSVPRCVTCGLPAVFLPNRKRYSARCADCNDKNNACQKRARGYYNR